tara:strand:+ start:1240 stop:1494 length:255 start_codon:yes stop_codon:yes gene_type:complete
MSSRDYHIRKYAAVEQSDGSYLNKYGYVYWYNEAGDIHREDGPACIHYNDVEWWLNDLVYGFDGWCIVLNKTDEQKMLLRLRYG